MSAAPPCAPGRFLELDVFRGLAALAVVLFHYTVRFEQLHGLEGTPPAFLHFGKYGVHFFFLISGFVIFWSLTRTARWRSFLLSRLSRIYPAYWVAATLTFGTVALFGLPGREVGVGTYLANLTMVQKFAGIPYVDGAYWTLTVELVFYFWISLIHFAGQLRRAELWFLPPMLLGALVNLGVVVLPVGALKFLLVEYANLFAAGIVLFRLYEGTDAGTARWFLPLSLAFNFIAYPWPDASLMAVFLLLMLLAVQGHLRRLCVAPLLWLGGISYSLYLVHQNIGYVVIREVRAAGGSDLLGLACALLVALTLADLLSRMVERPAAREIRRLFGVGRARERLGATT